MNIAALYHRSLDNWCYPLDAQTLHIRLQTAANDVDAVRLVAGDPYDWPKGAWHSVATPMRRAGSDGVHDFWEVTWSPPWKRTKYYFEVQSGTETWLYGERGLLPATAEGQDLHRNAFVFPYINEGDLFRAPDWVRSTVWYQIFPERFRNGDPALNPEGVLPWTTGPVTNKQFYGGDLPGIVEKLDHLSDLGVTGLYLTPVFQSPSVHKYDTADYETIDPAFGTADDLKRLVAEAHRRGIRVLLDAVFNHSGLLFAPWKDVATHGPSSRYAGWFHLHDGGYETFAFAQNMPKLRTANPEVRDYLIGVATHWMKTTGIDGWRLDVSNEVDHEFWRAFRKAVKAVNPEAYIVGEIWHDSQRWLRGDQYDAVMNYRYGNAVSDFVLGRNRVLTGQAFAQTIDAIDASYPLPVLQAAFNVLDSHDTDRFLTRCGGDKARARLGWLLLFALRGAPCIYYGSEVGLEGGHDPDNRRCMVWDETQQDRDQWDFLRQLVAIRRGWADVLAEGSRRWTIDSKQPDSLVLDVRSGDRGLRFEVVRSAKAHRWAPSGHEVLLSSPGPWAYRVTAVTMPPWTGTPGKNSSLR